MEDADAETEASLAVIKKKSRKKKVHDKWNALYFVPLDVINSRSRGSVRNGPRGGLQIYKDLLCKLCARLSHGRQNLRLHNETHHKLLEPSNKSHNASLYNSKHRTKASKKKRVHRVLEVVDLDDEEDDDEDEGAGSDDDVEILEQDSLMSRSVVGGKTDAELEMLARSSLFQPQIYLSSSLNKAIRRENKQQQQQLETTSAVNKSKTRENKKQQQQQQPATSTPTTSELNKSISDQYKTFKDKLKSLVNSRSKSKKNCTPAQNKKSNKRSLSVDKSVDVVDVENESVVDWSLVISGGHQDESVSAGSINESSSSGSSSPVKKKRFKPSSLLNRFNDSSKNDSGIDVRSEDTSDIFSPVMKIRDKQPTTSTPTTSSPTTLTPTTSTPTTTRTFLSVRDFAKTSSLDDSIVIEETDENKDQASELLARCFTSTGSNQQQQQNSLDNSVVMLDDEDDVEARASKDSPTSRIDSFVNTLKNLSKFTSTPKQQQQQQQASDIEIVEVF